MGEWRLVAAELLFPQNLCRDGSVPGVSNPPAHFHGIPEKFLPDFQKLSTKNLYDMI